MHKSLVLVLLLIACISIPTYAQTGKKLNKVILDAGHGGHDGGARGAFSNEKDLTLAIVLKLGKIISDSLRGVQAIYTRTTDVYQKPSEKHVIANQSKADLFVSVHINSTPFWKERIQSGTRRIKKKKKYIEVPVYTYKTHHTTTRSGVETLVLGSIRNNQKAKAVGEYGEDIADEPGLLNEDDPQTAIIISQYTKAFLGQSVSLGTHIQNAFAAQGRKDLGVKQQSLEVLAGSYMPGVLVECGFITNATEEDYLNSEQGQTEVALAIYRGIKAYKAEIER
jgi:N-acetylmuramoyl-L-alanine amidase